MFISKEKGQILRKYLSYGVPQGSILGPLSLILYIKDIAGLSENLCYVLIADDTNIF